MSNDYEENNEELAEAKADLSAENNAKQLNARMVIGRKSELARMKGLAEEGGEEMSGVDDGVDDGDPEGGLSDAYLVSDDTIKASLAKLPKAEELIKPKTYKLKVNGKEVELSEEEMIARAQKVEAADQYLAEAKRAAEAVRAQPVQQQPPAEQAEAAQGDTITDDDLALARALQIGSEEDAARAIARIRTRNAQKPSELNTDAVVQKVKADIEFQENVAWFKDAYPEIWADSDLMTLAVKRDAEIMQQEGASGTLSPYKERYSKIGDELRKKFGTDPGYSAKAKKKQETLTNIPTAHTKVRMPEVEDDSEESAVSVIAKMAAARGQRNLGV